MRDTGIPVKYSGFGENTMINRTVRMHSFSTSPNGERWSGWRLTHAPSTVDQHLSASISIHTKCAATPKQKSGSCPETSEPWEIPPSHPIHNLVASHFTGISWILAYHPQSLVYLESLVYLVSSLIPNNDIRYSRYTDVYGCIRMYNQPVTSGSPHRGNGTSVISGSSRISCSSVLLSSESCATSVSATSLCLNIQMSNADPWLKTR